ncbi:helix-turn-helix domain-containing protein [Brevibacillus laterosporus]|uniref:helix-turn-helix domain-containing protein n=1 Tax=Brevibacillus laterosporus TaxID=1465 RepID=UPI003D1D3294
MALVFNHKSEQTSEMLSKQQGGKIITTIGDIIRIKRMQTGKTRKDVEKNTKIDQSVIWKIENGKTKNPEYRTVKQIANYLGISFSEILIGYQGENRIEVLFDLLEDSIELNLTSETLFLTKRILESNDTVSSIHDLIGKTEKIQDRRLMLSILDVLLRKAIINNLNRLVAKIMFEKYMIQLETKKNFTDFEIYITGLKLLDYVDLLNSNQLSKLNKHLLGSDLQYVMS